MNILGTGHVSRVVDRWAEVLFQADPPFSISIYCQPEGDLLTIGQTVHVVKDDDGQLGMYPVAPEVKS